jgi:hypothetical protein
LQAACSAQLQQERRVIQENNNPSGALLGNSTISPPTSGVDPDPHGSASFGNLDDGSVSGSASALNKNPDPDTHPYPHRHQIKIRMRIRIRIRTQQGDKSNKPTLIILLCNKPLNLAYLEVLHGYSIIIRPPHFMCCFVINNEPCAFR